MSKCGDELARMLKGRDPRVDPREGDVVQQTNAVCERTGWTKKWAARRVIKPTAGTLGAASVCYQATPRSMGVESRWCSMRAWRRWAKHGQIVCRGEP